MRRSVIVDTGPVVALLNARDRHHDWAVAQWREIEPPLLTCESVISEACFLLAQTQAGGTPVIEMLARQALAAVFRLSEEARPVRALMQKYSDVPMSVADACLVRMAETIPQSTIFTLDDDFRRYRKHGRQVIPLLIPR